MTQTSGESIGTHAPAESALGRDVGAQPPRRWEEALPGIVRRVNLALAGRNHREVAELLGMHRETVRRQRSEQGPSVEMLWRLYSRLGIDPSWVLTGEGAMSEAASIDQVILAAPTERLLEEINERLIEDPTEVRGDESFASERASADATRPYLRIASARPSTINHPPREDSRGRA